MTNDKLYDYIYNSRYELHVDPDQKFFRNLVYGLSVIVKPENITCISIPPVSANTHSRVFWDEEICEQDNVRFIVPSFRNGKLNRYIDQRNNTLKHLNDWLATTEKEKRFVICDPLVAHVTKSVTNTCLRAGCKVIAVVTDLPLLWLQMGKKRKHSLSYYFNAIYNRLADRGLEKYDGYVWLTEEMNKSKNIHNSPFVIIEGFADIECPPLSDKECDFNLPKRFIMYAGGIHKIFRIDKLLKAFCLANIPNLDLLIYGDGDDIETIKLFEQDNHYIHYKGVIPSNMLKTVERRAILLVNPRPSTDEYTKYSFPSKTLEYMGSGTATLSTRLPGIPAEYFDYMYWFDDESEEGMSRTLRSIFSQSDEDIKKMGLKGSAFVYENKSAIKQSRKIIELFRQIESK